MAPCTAAVLAVPASQTLCELVVQCKVEHEGDGAFTRQPEENGRPLQAEPRILLLR